MIHLMKYGEFYYRFLFIILLWLSIINDDNHLLTVYFFMSIIEGFKLSWYAIKIKKNFLHKLLPQDDLVSDDKGTYRKAMNNK